MYMSYRLQLSSAHFLNTYQKFYGWQTMQDGVAHIFRLEMFFENASESLISVYLGS